MPWKTTEPMAILLQDRPVWIGALGTLGTVMLENIHLVVGILVGLTTMVYLLLRIRKELHTQRGSGETETTGKPAKVRRTDSGGCPTADRTRK